MNYKRMIEAYNQGENIPEHERTKAISFYFDVNQLAQQISWMALYRKAQVYRMSEEDAEQVYGIGQSFVQEIDKIRFFWNEDTNKWKQVEEEKVKKESEDYKRRLQRAQIMKNLRDRGMSTKQIAIRYGMTAERVRQIIIWIKTQQ